MIRIGDIEGPLKRFAIMIARRAAAVDGLVVWVSPSGALCCGHVATLDAAKILQEAPACVVGTYGPGARANYVYDDLHARAQELRDAGGAEVRP